MFIYNIQKFCVLLLAIMSVNLSLCSYNSKGLGPGRIPYIEKLLDDCDILLLQEIWLFNSMIPDLEQTIQRDITVHGVSGMPDDEVLSGRPYGGVAIIWK